MDLLDRVYRGQAKPLQPPDVKQETPTEVDDYIFLRENNWKNAEDTSSPTKKSIFASKGYIEEHGVRKGYVDTSYSKDLHREEPPRALGLESPPEPSWNSNWMHAPFLVSKRDHPEASQSAHSRADPNSQGVRRSEEPKPSSLPRSTATSSNAALTPLSFTRHSASPEQSPPLTCKQEGDVLNQHTITAQSLQDPASSKREPSGSLEHLTDSRRSSVPEAGSTERTVSHSYQTVTHRSTSLPSASPVPISRQPALSPDPMSGQPSASPDPVSTYRTVPSIPPTSSCAPASTDSPFPQSAKDISQAEDEHIYDPANWGLVAPAATQTSTSTAQNPAQADHRFIPPTLTGPPSTGVPASTWGGMSPQSPRSHVAGPTSSHSPTVRTNMSPRSIRDVSQVLGAPAPKKFLEEPPTPPESHGFALASTQAKPAMAGGSTSKKSMMLEEESIQGSPSSSPREETAQEFTFTKAPYLFPDKKVESPRHMDPASGIMQSEQIDNTVSSQETVQGIKPDSARRIELEIEEPEHKSEERMPEQREEVKRRIQLVSSNMQEESNVMSLEDLPDDDLYPAERKARDAHRRRQAFIASQAAADQGNGIMKTAAEAAEAVRRVQLHDASVAQQRQPQEATNRIDLMLAPHEWEEDPHDMASNILLNQQARSDGRVAFEPLDRNVRPDEADEPDWAPKEFSPLPVQLSLIPTPSDPVEPNPELTGFALATPELLKSMAESFKEGGRVNLDKMRDRGNLIKLAIQTARSEKWKSLADMNQSTDFYARQADMEYEFAVIKAKMNKTVPPTRQKIQPSIIPKSKYNSTDLSSDLYDLDLWYEPPLRKDFITPKAVQMGYPLEDYVPPRARGDHPKPDATIHTANAATPLEARQRRRDLYGVSGGKDEWHLVGEDGDEESSVFIDIPVAPVPKRTVWDLEPDPAQESFDIPLSPPVGHGPRMDTRAFSPDTLFPGPAPTLVNSLGRASEPFTRPDGLEDKIAQMEKVLCKIKSISGVMLSKDLNQLAVGDRRLHLIATVSLPTNPMFPDVLAIDAAGPAAKMGSTARTLDEAVLDPNFNRFITKRISDVSRIFEQDGTCISRIRILREQIPVNLTSAQRRDLNIRLASYIQTAPPITVN